jgi:hypothetical protein
LSASLGLLYSKEEAPAGLYLKSNIAEIIPDERPESLLVDLENC